MPSLDLIRLCVVGAVVAYVIWLPNVVYCQFSGCMFATFKGWLGESGARVGMWIWLNGKTYRRIHDLIIPSRGGTTQIDHVIVSIHGVFVVETKNMKGWIFGDERSPNWTQSIFGRKSRFQNPLHQNYRHVRSLAEFLDVPEHVMRPLVFFFGDCVIKTAVPPNVLTHGLCTYIKSFRDEILSEDQANAIYERLSAAKATPAASHSIHVANLRESHGGDRCPRCGEKLVFRIARRGAKAGSSFVGCSAYPRCRYTRS